MDLMSFQKLREGLHRNVAPAPLRAKAAAAERLRSALGSSGAFAGIEVEATGDRDRLVAGLCAFSPQEPVHQVADRLSLAWAAIRQDGWEAHSFLVEDGHVELQAATTRDGHFLTLHLVAQADEALVGVDLGPDEPRLPEQRGWLRRTLAGDPA